MIVLHNCALPYDGPVRPETCRKLGILHIIVILAKCVNLVGSRYNNNIVQGIPEITPTF